MRLNRPDVKAAELALASAYYTTNQARSAFYPSVNITGTLGCPCFLLFLLFKMKCV